MIVDSSVLHGMSYEKAKLYGMPHIGCEYTDDSMASTSFTDDVPACAVCGRTDVAHNRHHEPPRSNGTFRLETPMGIHVLRPALITLCGSGTTGHHGLRHSGRLKISWEWNDEEAEAQWWNGHLLSRMFHAPHGDWLWDYGHYVFDIDGNKMVYGRFK